MLRKMVFGPRGRLSTDLDFTCRTDIPLDDLTMMLLDALEHPYHGVAFRFDKQKDWYLTGDGCASNPVCSHPHNPTGVKIKLQISTRERPILSVRNTPQIDQEYFKLLPFRPEAIPCLTLEEAVAEKIRAASQRSKLRDLHDLAEVSMRPLNRDLIRSLAVYKLWTSGGPGLDFEEFRRRIADGRNYNLDDLRSLLRKDQSPDLGAVTRRVVEGYRFLGNLTELETVLAADRARRCQAQGEELIRSIVI